MSGAMSRDVRDAIGLIVQLLERFGPVSSKADEIVGQAKVLWQQDQPSDALDLLFEFSQAKAARSLKQF